MSTELARLHEAARAADAGRWHERLAASAAAAAAGAADPAMPGFPPEEVQRALNSAPAVRKMDQAFDLYRQAMAVFAAHGRPSDEPRFLDFGAGWGRIWRYFLRDFAPERMAAFDVDPRLAGFWNAAMLGARLDIGAPFAPLPYGDDTFDLVVSNSVFSHLSEPLNLHSARELARVLRPGGVLVGTTFGLKRLRRWRALLGKGEALGGRWRMREGIAGEFDRAIADYAAGRFVFIPTDDTRPGDYEIAAFSDAWIGTGWADWFELLEFDDTKPGQPVFVVRAWQGR